MRLSGLPFPEASVFALDDFGLLTASVRKRRRPGSPNMKRLLLAHRPSERCFWFGRLRLRRGHSMRAAARVLMTAGSLALNNLQR